MQAFCFDEPGQPSLAGRIAQTGAAKRDEAIRVAQAALARRGLSVDLDGVIDRIEAAVYSEFNFGVRSATVERKGLAGAEAGAPAA